MATTEPEMIFCCIWAIFCTENQSQLLILLATRKIFAFVKFQSAIFLQLDYYFFSARFVKSVPPTNRVLIITSVNKPRTTDYLPIHWSPNLKTNTGHSYMCRALLTLCPQGQTLCPEGLPHAVRGLSGTVPLLGQFPVRAGWGFPCAAHGWPGTIPSGALPSQLWVGQGFPQAACGWSGSVPILGHCPTSPRLLGKTPALPRDALELPQ